MFESPRFIPLTVVVAVLIFLLRELMEAHRRHNTNRRKLTAIKNQLAAECERNNWAIRWLRTAANDVRAAVSDQAEVKIQITAIGTRRLVFPSEDGDSSSPIPKTYTDILNKYLFEVASLDANLFERMIDAATSLAELDHVLNSLIEHAEDQGQFWLEGWSHYASSEIGDIEEPILYLYECCTGEALIKAIIR
jgi:cellobiose phosphorylase